MRANDPLYEIAMAWRAPQGGQFWSATLRARGGSASRAEVEDRNSAWTRRQWRKASNVWHNSVVR